MNEIINQLEIRRNELLLMRNDANSRLNKLKYKGKPEYRIRIDSKKNQIFIIERGKASKYLKQINRILPCRSLHMNIL